MGTFRAEERTFSRSRHKLSSSPWGAGISPGQDNFGPVMTDWKQSPATFALKDVTASVRQITSG